VADAVVHAETSEDILGALQVAQETEVPITPRGGGTGRTGGSVPVAGGIVLNMLGMNRIVDVDAREGVATVGPGVLLSDLHAAAEAVGLFYPPDPNSEVGCCIGGNVAENSGGPRGFKYGVTGDYVLGLDAYLMGGQHVFAGRHTKKGTTGYDIARLLVGSEGTLAVFGNIVVRLLPQPEQVMTLLVLFPDVHQCALASTALTAAGLTPRCIELFDETTLQVMRDSGNPLDLRARAMLIIEVDGDTDACERQAARVAGVCEDNGALDVLAAAEPAQRARLWAARKEMSRAVRKLARKKLSEDVVVPRRSIGTLLDRVAAIGQAHDVRILAYGHAGDGNLHVNFLWNEPDEIPRVDRAIEQVFRTVIELRGTLTGEHGVGATKAPYLPLEQSAPLIALQQEIKRAFDPLGLLNPGKIFPTTSSHTAF
jgi:glycolate oxidase